MDTNSCFSRFHSSYTHIIEASHWSKIKALLETSHMQGRDSPKDLIQRPLSAIDDGLPLFTELPRETVWKIETGPILEPHGRVERDQKALFGRLMLSEIAFKESPIYFPDRL
jgi:hypothetical protein